MPIPALFVMAKNRAGETVVVAETVNIEMIHEVVNEIFSRKIRAATSAAMGDSVVDLTAVEELATQYRSAIALLSLEDVPAASPDTQHLLN